MTKNNETENNDIIYRIIQGNDGIPIEYKDVVYNHYINLKKNGYSTKIYEENVKTLRIKFINKKSNDFVAQYYVHLNKILLYKGVTLNSIRHELTHVASNKYDYKKDKLGLLYHVGHYYTGAGEGFDEGMTDAICSSMYDDFVCSYYRQANIVAFLNIVMNGRAIDYYFSCGQKMFYDEYKSIFTDEWNFIMSDVDELCYIYDYKENKERGLEIFDFVISKYFDSNVSLEEKERVLNEIVPYIEEDFYNSISEKIQKVKTLTKKLNNICE